MSAILSAFIAFYLGRVHKAQGAELPEDRLDANIDDGDAELGFFSPWSWWPIVLAAGAALAFLGLAIGFWLSLIGGAVGAHLPRRLGLRVLPRQLRPLSVRTKPLHPALIQCGGFLRSRATRPVGHYARLAPTTLQEPSCVRYVDSSPCRASVAVIAAGSCTYAR